MTERSSPSKSCDLGKSQSGKCASGSSPVNQVGEAPRQAEKLSERILVISRWLFDSGSGESGSELERIASEVKRLTEQKFFEIKASPELEKRLAELALDNLEKGARLAKAQDIINECIEDSPDVSQYDDELYLHLPKFLIWKKRLEEALK